MRFLLEKSLTVPSPIASTIPTFHNPPKHRAFISEQPLLLLVVYNTFVSVPEKCSLYIFVPSYPKPLRLVCYLRYVARGVDKREQR